MTLDGDAFALDKPYKIVLKSEADCYNLMSVFKNIQNNWKL